MGFLNTKSFLCNCNCLTEESTVAYVLPLTGFVASLVYIGDFCLAWAARSQRWKE